jgi:NAD+ synthase
MIKDIEGLLRKIKDSLGSSTDVAVLGLSGGADSLLVALLCVDVLGKDNVYAVHMPASKEDFEGFNRRSVEIATALGVRQLLIPVGDASEALSEELCEGLAGGLSRTNVGNLRARMRMAALYGICHHLGDVLDKRVRVIGTGNLSEDFIGYDTKGGDALADIFPIGGLFKSEVYQLLDFYVRAGRIEDRLVDRVPSAGLWAGQTDEGELGVSYAAMETAIRSLVGEGLEGGMGLDKTRERELRRKLEAGELDAVEAFVLKRHLANRHKHEAPLVIPVRGFC